MAKKNASRNGVEAQIFSSDVYEAVEGVFDHVISNPPIRAGKKVVHQVITGSFEHLKPGGDLTIVDSEKQGAPSAKAKMEETFGNCEIVKRQRLLYFKKCERIMRAVDIIQKKKRWSCLKQGRN